jgi:hypothetical protein
MNGSEPGRRPVTPDWTGARLAAVSAGKSPDQALCDRALGHRRPERGSSGRSVKVGNSGGGITDHFSISGIPSTCKS